MPEGRGRKAKGEMERTDRGNGRRGSKSRNTS